MARDMQKNIEEYHKKNGRGNIGAFYSDDAAQIFNIVKSNPLITRERSARAFVFEAIIRSLEAGWIIGYRAGKREHRKRQQERRRTDESK